MAGAAAFSFEAAKPSFDVILKQSELLGSWSLAVFGGCVTIIAWHVQRRMDHPDLPNARCIKFVFAALCLEGLSILLMYLAYGGMINVITQLQFMKFESISAYNLTLAQKTSFGNWQVFFFFQFVTFFVGILLLGLFMARNYGATPPPTQPVVAQPGGARTEPPS